VVVLSEWLYAEVSLAAGASAPLDPEAEERSIYVVEGEVNIAARHSMGAAPHLSSGDRITVRAIFLGGAVLEGPRYIWWNFVSSRRSGSSKRKRIGRQ
jgi:redox-sensitive bicupin YhaK (pirin superfamily)